MGISIADTCQAENPDFRAVGAPGRVRRKISRKKEVRPSHDAAAVGPQLKSHGGEHLEMRAQSHEQEQAAVSILVPHHPQHNGQGEQSVT